MDVQFFSSLTRMYQAARGGLGADAVPDAVAVVHAGLEELHRTIDAAITPSLGPNALTAPPTLARVSDYVDKGGTRLDASLRFFSGRWNRDIKLVVEVDPWGAWVFLTSWMAQRDPSAAYAEFLQAEEAWVRARLVALSEQLIHEYGECLQLRQSVRSGSHEAAARGWPEDDRDWTIWSANPVGQSTVGLWLEYPVTREFVLEHLDEDVLLDERSAAARLLGGAAGYDVLRTPELAVEAAVDQAIGGAQRRLRGHLARGSLAPALADAAAGLASVLARFTDREAAREVRSLAPVGFDAEPEAIIEQVKASACALDGRAAQLQVERPKSERAVLGWGSRSQPWIEVIRRKEGTLSVSFHADQVEGRYVGGMRPLLANALRGATGEGLQELIRTSGGALSARCGSSECARRGRCPEGAQFVRHWLLTGRKPVLEWRIPSSRGNPRWLELPAHVLTSLLLQVLPQPPQLGLPRVAGARRDVFLSTPGTAIKFLGKDIARVLQEQGRLSVWYMADHQQIGTDIDVNTSDAIERARIVVVVLHPGYWASEHCRSEFIESVRLEKPLVPLALTPDGDPAQASAQLPDALARLEEMRAQHAGELVDAAVAAATRLYGKTIRATLSERDRPDGTAALADIASTAHELLGAGHA